MAFPRRRNMAGEATPLMERSIGINRQLAGALETAIERNAILRIGWTADGTEVPKDGESGLCPFLPEGARVRALGRLGPWISTGSSGSFDHRGDAGNMFGAALQDGRLLCEGHVGHMAGWSMRGGTLVIEDGCGDDLGASMHDGVVLVRGKIGRRAGTAMRGGLIVVHGDVEHDPGCGMRGGMIVIDGRCPAPGPGVTMRPLSASELKDVNARIEDPTWQVPADAVCLVPSEDTEDPSEAHPTRLNAMDGLALMPTTPSPLLPGASVDTTVLLGRAPLALPLPVLPHVLNGERLRAKRSKEDVAQALAEQPFLVDEAPRAIDMLRIGEGTLHAWSSLPDAAGAVIDLGDLPPMDPASLEGLLVLLSSMCDEQPSFTLLGDAGRVTHLHRWSAEHGMAAAFMDLSKRPDLPVPAMMPLSGRSANATLNAEVTQSGVKLDWIPSGRDLVLLGAGGLGLSIFTPEDDGPAALASLLHRLRAGMTHHLQDLGLQSVDALGRAHLRATALDIALMSGLRVAGFERPLPDWTR